MAFRGGLTLSYADNTGQGWPTVIICGGLTLDVPDPLGALRWANDKNRRTSVGKYYVATTQDGSMAAVVYENSIWGGHTRFLLEGPHGTATFTAIAGWLGAVFHDTVTTAAHDGEELLAQFGGRRFPLDDDGLINLFTISSG